MKIDPYAGEATAWIQQTDVDARRLIN